MVSFYSTLLADLCFLEIKAKITSWDSVSNYLIYIRALLLLNRLKIALVGSLWENITYSMCRLYALLSDNDICCCESFAFNSFICSLCLWFSFLNIKVFPYCHKACLQTSLFL